MGSEMGYTQRGLSCQPGEDFQMQLAVAEWEALELDLEELTLDTV